MLIPIPIPSLARSTVTFPLYYEWLVEEANYQYSGDVLSDVPDNLLPTKLIK